MKKLAYIILLIAFIAVTTAVITKYSNQKREDSVGVEAVVQLDENEVPIYPGAILITNKDSDETKWEVWESVSKVASFYMSTFLDHGWVIKSPPEDPSSETMQIITAEKLNKAYQVEISSTENLTQIKVSPKPVEDNSKYTTDAEEVVVSVVENEDETSINE